MSQHAPLPVEDLTEVGIRAECHAGVDFNVIDPAAAEALADAIINRRRCQFVRTDLGTWLHVGDRAIFLAGTGTTKAADGWTVSGVTLHHAPRPTVSLTFTRRRRTATVHCDAVRDAPRPRTGEELVW